MSNATLTWQERQALLRELDEAPTPPSLDDGFDADISDQPTLVPEGEER